MASIDQAIAELAERQHRCFTRRQVLALGLSSSAFGARVRSGRFHRHLRGVYSAGDRVLPPLGRAKAAELAAGPGAALSHFSAAALWDLSAHRSRLEVSVPLASRRAVAGVRIRRIPGLLDRDVGSVRGIRATTPMRTVFDLAAELDAAGLDRLIARADVLRVLDVSALQGLADRHARRPGAARLLRALDRHVDLGSTRSALEDDFLELVTRLDLPLPQANRRVGSAIPDFIWPAARLVVELDSWEHHGSRRAFHLDRSRNAELVARGWRVMQVTAMHLRDDRAALGDRLRRALRP